jgi:thiol-disulfide isomerase/thioredoxin
MSAIGSPSETAPTALPRWLAAIIIGAIALASLTALIWPSLPFNRQTTGLPNVGIVREQIQGEGMGGRIGALAPDFEYYAPGGRLVRLSDYRGKVVVVNFWATYCRPCREELPAMNRVAAAEPDVVFLALADYTDTAEKVDSFFTQLSIDRVTPVLQNDLATSTRYGVLSLPTTFFIDQAGVIRHLEIGTTGGMSADEIRRGIAKAR